MKQSAQENHSGEDRHVSTKRHRQTAVNSSLSFSEATRPFSPTHLLQLQQTLGNTAVQRLIIQRDDDNAPLPQGEPEMTDATVPVPQQQQEQAQQAAHNAAPTAEGEQEQPPPAPEEAQIRVPVQFNFELLPPELQIRLLEEFNFTATVTAARLAWQRERFRLRLGYDYGGAITAEGRGETDVGTFSGRVGYDPGSEAGSLGFGYQSRAGAFSATGGYNFGTGAGTMGLGYEYGRFRAGLTGSTAGELGGNISFGAALPPIDLAPSIYAAEASGQAMLGSVPGVLDDPATLPGVISGHSTDISNVGTAVRDLGRVADLRPHGARDIDWGFYLRARGSPSSGFTLGFGAGAVF
jgi:hypothetical protein